MYLILLVLGAGLTAAGIALGASGVSIHERAFDATIVTPGIVAAVGGLLLIGLGLGLRVLRRIELALAARPMLRPARPGEASETSAVTDLPIEPARIPLPSKIASAPQPASIARPVPPAGEKPLEDLLEKFPSLTRFESGRVVEETDLSLLPTPPARTEEDIGEVNNARAARRRNGAAPARIAPRLDVSARPSVTSDRLRGPTFDALWPKGQRPLRAAQSPAQAAATPAALEPQQHSSEPALDAPATGVAQDEAPASISILKSGVVDGMAYTLYSDGSIEAQLPQGMLRFGSIAELRNHMEQGPQSQ
jgi:hypothetical protein